MRTHILLALIALFTVACASKEHPDLAHQAKEDQKQVIQTKSEYSQIDGASAIR